jgi:hypothetical protein
VDKGVDCGAEGSQKGVPCVKEVVVHGTKAREVRESEFRVSGGAPCQVQAVFDDVQGSVLYVLTWRWREADSEGWSPVLLFPGVVALVGGQQTKGAAHVSARRARGEQQAEAAVHVIRPELSL